MTFSKKLSVDSSYIPLYFYSGSLPLDFDALLRENNSQICMPPTSYSKVKTPAKATWIMKKSQAVVPRLLVLASRHAGLPRGSSCHLGYSLLGTFSLSVFAVLLLGSRKRKNSQQFQLGLLLFLGRVMRFRISGGKSYTTVCRRQVVTDMVAVHIYFIRSWQRWSL